MIYLISYDLRKPGKDYQSLIKALKEANCARILESVWLLKDSKNAIAIRDILRTHMDENDGVVVIEINPNNWASHKTLTKIQDFLDK